MHLKHMRIALILFSVGFASQNISAQATGTCTAGTEYCEASTSNDTTTTTTTTDKY